MAETTSEVWRLTAPAHLVRECQSGTRYAVVEPGGGVDAYVGPTITVDSLGGRHRVLTLAIPTQPTWRNPVRVLASV